MTTKKLPSSAFKKGVSGNPAGRPIGALSKSTRMLTALMQDGAADIAKTVIAAAKAGDLTAAKIVLDKLIPAARERPLDLYLPDARNAEGISEAQSVILNAAALGDIYPGEASVLSGILESKRRSIETQELSDRISKLEERHAKP